MPQKGANHANTERTPYDVVVSFAGEDRSYAERLSECLARHGISVFYDRYERATLWGKDLYEHLSWVYRDAGKYCVMFVSESYARNLWTNHERRAAQARAFKEKREYILPVRLDRTEIPGLLETVGYVDLREISIEDICNLVLDKLELLPPQRADETFQPRTPRRQPIPLSPELASVLKKDWEKVIGDGFDSIEIESRYANVQRPLPQKIKEISERIAAEIEAARARGNKDI